MSGHVPCRCVTILEKGESMENNLGPVLQALKSAGQDFWPTLSPVKHYGARVGNLCLVTDQHGIVRSPTAVVSDRYVPMANRDCFSNLDQFCQDRRIGLDSIRVYSKGSQVTVKVKIPHLVSSIGRKVGDVLQAYIVASNSFDGRSRIGYRSEVRRVICTNGMSSLSSGWSRRVRHSSVALPKVRELDLREIEADLSATAGVYNRALDIGMSRADVISAAYWVLKGKPFDIPSDSHGRAISARRQFANVVRSSTYSTDNYVSNHAGSVAGLINAVTEYETVTKPRPAFHVDGGDKQVAARMQGVLSSVFEAGSADAWKQATLN